MPLEEKLGIYLFMLIAVGFVAAIPVGIAFDEARTRSAAVTHQKSAQKLTPTPPQCGYNGKCMDVVRLVP